MTPCRPYRGKTIMTIETILTHYHFLEFSVILAERRPDGGVRGHVHPGPGGLHHGALRTDDALAHEEDGRLWTGMADFVDYLQMIVVEKGNYTIHIRAFLWLLDEIEIVFMKSKTINIQYLAIPI